jgi:hypothetical protein
MMPRMLLRLLVRLVLLALLAAFVAYVWPTMYRYDHLSTDGSTYPVRINRLNGDSDMLVPDEGWVPVEGDSQGGDSTRDNHTTAFHRRT